MVVQNAILNASGNEAGEQGGEIEILGDHIAMDQSIINASGYEATVHTQHPYEDGTATLTTNKAVRKEEEFLEHEQ